MVWDHDVAVNLTSTGDPGDHDDLARASTSHHLQVGTRRSLPLTAQAMICLVIVGNDIELDAVGSQFEPYPYRRMRLHAGGALVARV